MGPLSYDGIREIAYGFQQSRILLTAFELDVFSLLGKDGLSSAEVASASGTDQRATDRLLNALCAIGLLEKDGNRFMNTVASSRFLARGRPEFMAGLMHTVHLWTTWSTLTEAVRRGRPAAIRHVDDRGQEWLTAFIAAMHARASSQAAAVVRGFDLAGVTRVLDVGGGSGAYAMAFARAKRGLRATVFDLPNVVPLTRTYVQQEGMSDSVETVTGDYLKDDLGKDYDLVFLSAIIHSNSFEENTDLIRKCAGALRPQGRVVVQDFIMEEDRVSPAAGAIFALNMLVGTEAGDTYTESEVRMMMNKAGLPKVQRKETPFGVSQIIGAR